MSIDESLSRLRALLRLIDPESPFQPILLSTINMPAWLAHFARASQQLSEALREMPDAPCRSTVLEAFTPFIRLVDTLCEHAELHAFPPAEGYPDELPEMAEFCPKSAMCKEDAETIDVAINTAARVLKASSEHRRLLVATLALATTNLKNHLSCPNGLLALMRKRCRKSKSFSRKYARITEGLKEALARLPDLESAPGDQESTPWKECRISLAEIRFQLEEGLIPQLETIFKELSPTTKSTSTKAKNPAALKFSVLRVATAFLEIHRLTRSCYSQPLEVQYHALFRPLFAKVTESLDRCSNLTETAPSIPRLIDDIQRLSPELIDRDVLTAWDASLPAADAYSIEVVLAALHHLERPEEDSDELPGKGRLVFGFSDGDLARWLRRGTYIGANPQAEASKNMTAEKKRSGRTLQYLRRMGAAFHDRRQWTPTHSWNASSTQHRLWTVNPLLALLPRIAARLEVGTPSVASGGGSTSSGSRPRPSRRNRGTRPKASD